MRSVFMIALLLGSFFMLGAMESLSYQEGTNPLFSFIGGGSYIDTGSGIAMDTEGNIYVVGTVQSKGDDGLRSNFHLLKVSTSGNLLWNRTWNDPEGSHGDGVTLDSNRNVYTIGNAIFPFLVKWDGNGNILWNQSLISGVFEDITVDSNGSIYVVGTNSYKMLLVKWGSAGNQIWYNSWGSESQPEHGYGVDVDSSGSIYTTGTRQNSTGLYHVLRKWDVNGTLICEASLGNSYGTDLVLDAENNIYTVGSCDNYLQLVKWNATGNRLWNRTWGGSGWKDLSVGHGIAISSDNRIYTVGYSSWFPSCYSTDYIGGCGDLILNKWDSSGILLGTKLWDGGSSEAYGEDVVIGSDGNIYCVGDDGSDIVVLGFSPNNFLSDEELISRYSSNVTPFPFPGLELPLVVFTICFLAFFAKKKRSRK